MPSFMIGPNLFLSLNIFEILFIFTLCVYECCVFKWRVYWEKAKGEIREKEKYREKEKEEARTSLPLQRSSGKTTIYEVFTECFVCSPHICSSNRGQKRALDRLDLELRWLWVARWVLWVELGFEKSNRYLYLLSYFSRPWISFYNWIIFSLS